jgi:hypothetical protein
MDAMAASFYDYAGRIYTGMMAAANNSIWRSLVSLICVAALLFVAIPCGFCSAPHAAALLDAMPGAMPVAANCTPCCPGAPTVISTPPCCTAYAATVDKSASTLRVAVIRLAVDHSAPVTLGRVAARITTHRVAPPPLLQTNLRI